MWQVEGEYNHGVVELAERIGVVVIAAVLEACISFLIRIVDHCVLLYS